MTAAYPGSVAAEVAADVAWIIADPAVLRDVADRLVAEASAREAAR